MRKFTALLVLLCMIGSLVMTACLREVPISENAGVGRETGGSAETNAPEESDTVYSPPPLDNDTETEATEAPTVTPPAASTDSMWSYENGKYTYDIPAPARNLSDLSDINSTPRTLFEDQGDDATGSWYPGSVVRDLVTGEVTYNWDRYQSTKDLIEKYNGIYRGDETEKVCYLTFDSGYELGYTTLLLDTLKEKNCPATFFLVGHYYRTEKELVNRMIDEGHIVGNHTINHYNMTTVSAETFIEEIETVEREIAEMYPNAMQLRYWRPPMGACSEWVLKMADKMGLVTVMWSFAYYDYDPDNQPTYEVALNKAKSGLHNGCVYLFHTESATNAAMLGELIDWIRAQGYEIRPICDIK